MNCVKFSSFGTQRNFFKNVLTFVLGISGSPVSALKISKFAKLLVVGPHQFATK